MAEEESFLDFPIEEDHDGVVEEEDEEAIVTLHSFPCSSHSHFYVSDSDSLSPGRRDAIGGEPADRKNQVTFVMDLFHQRVEQSYSLGREEFLSESVFERNFGVTEGNSEMGVNSSRGQLGLGLGSGIGLDEFVSESLDEQNFGVIVEYSDMDANSSRVQLGLGLRLGSRIGLDGNGDDDEDDCNCGGSVVSDCEDVFFDARRESGCENLGSSLCLGGVRVVEINSDSESDVEDGVGLLGICLNSEEEDFAVDNANDDDINIAFCWDSFHLDDLRDSNNDIEWEELDDRFDEREALSFVVDPDEEGSVSILPFLGTEEDGDQELERVREPGNVEWEVLVNTDNPERIPEMENDPGPYFIVHDDQSYTAEYELMFGPLADGENPLLARPPASKSVVEKLPSVIIIQDDGKERALCAVCKDQIEVNEEVKELPCSHWYHSDCILPWLGIRNTCPVCRYELPTDDPDYESRRTRRAARFL